MTEHLADPWLAYGRDPYGRDPFHHAAGLQSYSAGKKRWPRIIEVRATTDDGARRWIPTGIVCRTRRVAFRKARELRDQHGILYRHTPGAKVFAVRRLEAGTWTVMTTTARGKR